MVKMTVKRTKGRWGWGRKRIKRDKKVKDDHPKKQKKMKK